ncbi:MAG TPA: class I SAM-dependent methyltransferase [Planctomycetota bacterium]|nr:class I SAM-dependent methyltransferase [Planctomycetota bacterium]
MANFQPLKNYMLYCLDKFIQMEHLEGPFLDIGCGIGDVSLYLAKKGWSGTSIDYSDIAVERAKKTLAAFPNVTVRKAALEEMEGSFKTVILWDVLEHIEQDEPALEKISTLLAPGGRLLLAVPSNPREWRWDDPFYGHFRRYTTKDMSKKLTQAGLKPLLFWDFTFPTFWILRRLYTLVKRAPKVDEADKEKRTKESSTVNAWAIPVISYLLNKSTPIWRLNYWLQFRLFRKAAGVGHEFFALAGKPA